MSGLISELNKIVLPKKINPCPILESIIELRFSTSFPHDAIFGIIYKEFKDIYPHWEPLPILQLPEMVRREDQNFLYKPYYKLYSKDNYLLQVGAKMISLIRLAPYSGWNGFSKRFREILDKVNKLKIIDSYIRIGIRYVNEFDGNIFDKINLSINIKKYPLGNFSTFVQSEIPTGKFISLLRVSNKAEIVKPSGKMEKSIIDIDSFNQNPEGDIWELIEEGHLEEKRLFFSLLKEEFIREEFNPKY